jgi:hypothetical protein
MGFEMSVSTRGLDDARIANGEKTQPFSVLSVVRS